MLRPQETVGSRIRGLYCDPSLGAPGVGAGRCYSGSQGWTVNAPIWCSVNLPIPIWLCSQVHMKGMQPSEERDLDCMLGFLGPSAGSILIRCMSLNKSLISCFVSFGAKNENVPISHGPLLLTAWMSTVSFLFLLHSRLSG